MPALKSTRPDIVSTLRGERPIGRGAWRGWTMRDFLVMGQMAVTDGAADRRRAADAQPVRRETCQRRLRVAGRGHGVRRHRMLRYSNERSRQFFDEALRRVRALPGVQAAAIAYAAAVLAELQIR